MNKPRLPRISANAHGLLDYLWGSALILSPYLLGFQEAQAGKNFFAVLGAMVIFYSLLTDYRPSLFKVVPLGFHRVLDACTGLLIAVAPSLFNYVQYLTVGQRIAHIVVGAVIIGLALLVRTPPSSKTFRRLEENTEPAKNLRDRPETWIGALGAILTSLAVIMFLIVLPSNLNQGAKQQAGQIESGWKAMTPKEPVNPESRAQPLPLEGFVPPGQQGIDSSRDALVVEVRSDPAIPAFSPEKITIQPGEIVKLTFKNMSTVSHFDNFVLVHPGAEEDVGEGGLKAGPDSGYIPVMPDKIIAHTKMIPPGESDTIIFRAPSEPGLYPYLSTFPRRWRAMRGILEVVKK